MMNGGPDEKTLREAYELLRQENPDKPFPPYDDLNDEQRELHRLSFIQMRDWIDQRIGHLLRQPPLYFVNGHKK